MTYGDSKPLDSFSDLRSHSAFKARGIISEAPLYSLSSALLRGKTPAQGRVELSFGLDSYPDVMDRADKNGRKNRTAKVATEQNPKRQIDHTTGCFSATYTKLTANASSPGFFTNRDHFVQKLGSYTNRTGDCPKR